MMKNFTLISLLLLLLLSVISTYGQQPVSYSQFSMNKQQLNPAYIGYREAFNTTLTHRSQWVGFKGAPTTQTINFELPIKEKSLTLGFGITHDKTGPISLLNTSFDLAYKLRLNNSTTLSFGTKASAMLYQSNLSDVALASDFYGEVDEDFIETNQSILLPNIGFGLYYYSEKRYIGISNLQMIKNKFGSKSSLAYELMKGSTEPTYIFMMGQNIDINSSFIIQPNIISYITINTPLSIGLHTNIIYMNEIILGLNYQHNEIYGGLIQWQLNNKWKIGYSLELSPYSSLASSNYGTHEILLNLSIKAKSNKNEFAFPSHF